MKSDTTKTKNLLKLHKMDEAQTQLIEKLKAANSVLVTVSRDPSVDQLSALLGLTLLLNKQGKHAAAVFSGQVPSTLEFLKPEETFEQNTDSLRDFIIALDKNKADKLRYKVEDNVVRIFITPYRTSITQDDLEFSQGDFNIDLVVGIGVSQQEDLDEAITAHGRILHDATVASINTSTEGGLGSINWHDPGASSLSELVARLAQALGDNLLDEQIATSLLTGIVAETERFSNEKTSSQTMSASAALMAAGANQQLVASKLGENTAPNEVKLQDDDTGDDIQSAFDKKVSKKDGEIAIDHEEEAAPEGGMELPTPSEDEEPEQADEPEPKSNVSPGAKLVTEPPTLGGVLTANAGGEALDPVTDPMSLPNSEPPQLLDHQMPTTQPTPPPSAGIHDSPPQFTPPPPAWTPPAPPQPEPPAQTAPLPEPPQPKEDDNQTLSQLEESVESPHLEKDLGEARDEVSKALNSVEAPANTSPEPIQALNALPIDLNPADLPSDPTVPGSNTPPSQPVDSNAPPPVPPPIPFQFGNPQSNMTDQP
jgi:hypothetical protein